MGTDDTSWTRALMATAGIAIGHDTTPRHASAEWYEAGDVDTPMTRVQKLATSKDSEVRTVVARRPDCPMGILATLAFDHDSDVRAAVAGNPRIAGAVAAHLAKDRDAKVVKALARNHVIDLPLLQALALHRKEDIRRVASRNLDERIHGADGATVSDEGRALSAQAVEADQALMPRELRDRASTYGEWFPVTQAADAPIATGVRATGPFTNPVLPRLHPN